jgi:hypothetical protein
MARIRYAIEIVTYWAKEYPIRFALWIACFDAAFAGIAYFVTSEVKEDRGLIVAGAVITGLVVALGILLVWALIIAPRLNLQIRVTALEEGMQSLSQQMGDFLQDRFGEPFQFLPIYHELRTDIREAHRILCRARDTGRLWKRTDAPDASKWKKHREAIATSPWARLDNLHGPLLEAFDHIERLVTKTSVRFFTNRTVRSTDDLDEAIAAVENAEAGLTFAIDRLEPLVAAREAEN